MYSRTQIKIKKYLNEAVMPGVSYAFFKGGQVETQTEGFAQIVPKKELLTASMLFDMASLTIVIGTTTMILKLLEAGKIAIDCPLQVYLPSYRDERVTLRHLLTHTSDINGYIENRNDLSASELQKAILQLKSSPNLGEKIVYTDTGTILLGFMLEEIYERPVQNLFMTEILQPLRMKTSTFQPVAADCAASEIHPTRGLIRGQVHDPKAHILGIHCGSAGLFSSLADSVAFVQMLLAKGRQADGSSFLQEKTILSLLQNYAPVKTGGRSLGWDLKFSKRDGHPLLFHTGYTGTFLLVDILDQEAFIFLSNRTHPADHRAEYVIQRNQLIEEYLQEQKYF